MQQCLDYGSRKPKFAILGMDSYRSEFDVGRVRFDLSASDELSIFIYCHNKTFPVQSGGVDADQIDQLLNLG